MCRMPWTEAHPPGRAPLWQSHRQLQPPTRPLKPQTEVARIRDDLSTPATPARPCRGELKREQHLRAEEIHDVAAHVIVTWEKELRPEMAGYVAAELIFEDALEIVAAEVAATGDSGICAGKGAGRIGAEQS